MTDSTFKLLDSLSVRRCGCGPSFRLEIAGRFVSPFNVAADPLEVVAVVVVVVGERGVSLSSSTRRIIVRPRPAAVRVDPHNGRCERIGVSCVAVNGLHARAANRRRKAPTGGVCATSGRLSSNFALLARICRFGLALSPPSGPPPPPPSRPPPPLLPPAPPAERPSPLSSQPWPPSQIGTFSGCPG